MPVDNIFPAFVRLIHSMTQYRTLKYPGIGFFRKGTMTTRVKSVLYEYRAQGDRLSIYILIIIKCTTLKK